jgi:integrase
VKHVVKYRSVSITVYPWTHPSGREYWRYKSGGKHVTRADLDDAKKSAREAAQAIYRGALDLDTLTPEQVDAMKRMIEVDPSCRLVDEFLVWHGKHRPMKPLRDAEAEFLAAKGKARGTSRHNIDNLTRHCAKLPSMILSDIRPADLPPIPGSARTRSNVQAVWVTFFRWCVKQEYLPHGEPTAPERLERPIIVRGVPATWSPDELRVLLAAVRPQYLPWLALAAFAGLRTEEVIPQHGSAKIPLAWEDFHWDRDIIIVRPETAKTGRRRVIPINPALRSWLVPGTGRIGPHTHPSKPSTNGALAETTRLGLLVGGWRRNALRHSFISFRSALIGLAATAMEAGNSESEARRSYNDAKGADEAVRWFAVTP